MEKLPIESLELARMIAHEIWEKYDDTYGYRTEKQTQNQATSSAHPDNIWSFWGQFDGDNQERFYELALDCEGPGAIELQNWCSEQIKKTRAARSELREMGIDL